MAAATQTKDKLYTAPVLDRLDAQGCRYELIEGELREMPPTGGTHGSATSRLAYHIERHVYDHNLGECFSAEVGVYLSRNPDTILAPDFAFITGARLPAELPDSYLAIIPDLVFETRSPGDTKRDITAEMRRWLDSGVRLAWDIDPKSRTVTVYETGRTPQSLGPSDTLTGGDVLPDFSLPVGSIFRTA